MRHFIREFLWILTCVLSLSLLPWWQAVLVACLTTTFLLRLTEKGLKRRGFFLFIAFMILFFGFHASDSAVSSAISQLFRLPHYTLLATISAVCFALVFALAAESVLWIKFSIRRLTQHNKSKS